MYLKGLGGIERSKQKLREAEIVLFISDIHKSVEETIAEFNDLQLTKDQTGVILLNKADTIPAAQEPKTHSTHPPTTSG
ncbi:MAG: hypothetical protein IPN86_04255 [Saprospiraceae bacterium]|nr:hypothetical protein [Saprospiraceae bacterium]